MSRLAVPSQLRVRPGRREVDSLVALVGPTGVGKTEAAVELAHRIGAEIIVVDSMTVYRGMDIGTAKPTRAQQAAAPHHLLDIADPAERFSVARYQGLALTAIEHVRERGLVPLLAGGSGLYYRAIVDRLRLPGSDPRVRRSLEAEARVIGAEALHARLAELDPVAGSRIEPTNVRRTVRALEVAAITGRPFSTFARDWERYPAGRVRSAGVKIPAAILHGRIEARVDRMLAHGLVAETLALVERGFSSFLTATQAIGYLEIVEHLEDRMSLDEARARIVRRTKDLARRQMAWFRRDPRIRWFEAGEGGAVALVDDLETRLG